MISAPETVPSAQVLDDIESRLDAWFRGCPESATAFSGGVDSALVAFWARRSLGKQRSTAWIADSPSLKREDLTAARSFCATHDIALQELSTDELENPSYARNHFDRCFHCKSTLYSRLGEALQSTARPIWICSGANLDDQGDYRPGLNAAAQARVRHPLMECGVGKAAIRAIARRHGLAVWDRPASPCLSSRIPYGQPVTLEKLSQIEHAEVWLNTQGFAVCRVRHWGNVARIEVPEGDLARLHSIQSELENIFSRLGFTQIEIDGEGFVSGKLNRALSAAERATA